MSKVFIQDNECHWYLIDYEDKALFIQLEENGEADDYSAFNNKFYDCQSFHPSHYEVEIIRE